MMIALDYDDTYTRDPDGWDQVVAFLRSRGHTFVCVTGRSETAYPRGRAPDMPFVFAPDQMKSGAAHRAGYNVDVWIDDNPGTICQPQILQW